MQEKWDEKSEQWQHLWRDHRGKMTGTLFGMLLGTLFLFVGFWRTVIFGLFIYAGYYFGKKADNKEDLRDVLHRIMPDYFRKD